MGTGFLIAHIPIADPAPALLFYQRRAARFIRRKDNLWGGPDRLSSLHTVGTVPLTVDTALVIQARESGDRREAL